MANPNIAAATSIFGESVNLTIGLANSIILQQNLTGTVFKINTIIACNTGASDITVSVRAAMPSTMRYIARNVAVPANTTLVVVSKETSFYLEEACTLYAFASVNSSCDLTISYEAIS